MSIFLTEIIFFTAGFCGIITLIMYHIRRLHFYREAAKFAGPRALPILGNAHYFVGDTENILSKVIKLVDTYPSPFRVWMGNRLIFGVYDADHMKTILLSPKAIEKDDLYKFIRPWLGTGLLTAPAAKWRIHRKLIMPTFNQKILESFIEVFVKQSQILTQEMAKELNKDEFDIFHYVSLCTLDIICETAMGLSIKAQTGNYNRYVNSATRVFEIFYLRIYKIWLHSDLIFNLTKLGKDQRKCVNYLHGVTNDVIQKKKSAYNNINRVENETVDAERLTTKKTFLDLLMELSNNGAKLTDEEVREEVDTMMLAGNDTSATVISFTITMLANFPEVQERAYQELCEIYGDEVSLDTPVKNEDLNRMEYIERVIKETMRLFPLGPVLIRQITEDIKIGDHTLPKGSSVALGIIKTHRWEKYWPDPFKFDPDRFLPEEVAKRHPYCYLPFSAGPRNCIGLKFAMMAMKTLLATVLRRYVFKKDKFLNIQDIKLKADITLKPVETLTVKIVERTVDKNIN